MVALHLASIEIDPPIYVVFATQFKIGRGMRVNANVPRDKTNVINMNLCGRVMPFHSISCHTEEEG